MHGILRGVEDMLPWGFLILSLAVGFVLGYLVGKRRKPGKTIDHIIKDGAKTFRYQAPH
jgi:hypothetical protein